MDDAPSSTDPFHKEVQRIRDAGVLGRSAQLQRLFEFLVECRATGRVPKEIEVAVDCFERRIDMDTGQDATVRVTAHKLRRRLEDFYRDEGQPARLTIPRGEYRLALAEPVVTEVLAGKEAQAVPVDLPRWRRLLPATGRERVLALGALAAVVMALLIPLLFRDRPVSPPAVREVLASPLWAPLLADDLPVQFVLGDYYIFGERDERGQVQRLVREFDINSRIELESRLAADPDARYAHLNLAYLPTSSAQALREVLPVVLAAGKPVILTLASDLDPATVKSTHVVYIGYLSALGMLEDLVLDASRYSIGGSYDELVNSVSGEAYVSEAGELHPPGTRYRDYAYLAALKGPGGHAHLVIAGTRDIGLMQAAEIAAGQQWVGDLRAHLPAAGGPFEALYEVQGVDGLNVAAHLVDASGQDADFSGASTLNTAR